MTKLLILLLLSIGLYSCKDEKHNNGIKTILKEDPFNWDSIALKTIPDYLELDSSFINYFSRINYILELDTISNGTQGFQIRIWVGSSSKASKYLLIIKGTHSVFSLTHYSFALNFDTKSGVELISKNVKTRNPKSGWTIFTDSLDAIDVKNFVYPRKLIQEYYLPTDSCVITIEYADSNHYKFFQYPYFDRYRDKMRTMGGKLKRLFQFLKKEIDFDPQKLSTL